METTKQKCMTIGTLAEKAGVSVETIRFYQRKGLIETPLRISGFRKYSEDDVKKVRFIKRVQNLGFSLKGAQELLKIMSCSQETRPLLAKVAHDKIDEIEQKILDLNSMVEKLHQFQQACGNDDGCEIHCHLIDCFENDWECCDR